MQNPDNQQRWHPCEPGQLQRMATTLRVQSRRRFRRKVTVISSMVAATMLGLAAFKIGVLNQAVNPPLELSCMEVIPLLGPFSKGQIEANLAARVRTHLRSCDACEALFQRLFPGTNFISWIRGTVRSGCRRADGFHDAAAVGPLDDQV